MKTIYKLIILTILNCFVVCIVAIWIQYPDDFWILITRSVLNRKPKIRVVHLNPNYCTCNLKIFD